MVSSDLHAVTVRLDVLRDIMIELAAALPPDRAAGVVTAIGNRLTERLCDMEIDEPTDDAMVSDLAVDRSKVVTTVRLKLSFRH